jgi:hypothetical protein
MAQWKYGRTRDGSEHEFTHDEKVASIFQPDTVLSAQYFGNLRNKTFLEAEKKLMFAILEDAIDCYRDNVLTQSGKAKTLFDEAESWIVETGSDWIFSFGNVCEALGFNPEYIREGLFRWKENNRGTQSAHRASGKQRAAG